MLKYLSGIYKTKDMGNHSCDDVLSKSLSRTSRFRGMDQSAVTILIIIIFKEFVTKRYDSKEGTLKWTTRSFMIKQHIVVMIQRYRQR